ncbi:hypothetical protein DERF_001535 [Dermatophagoides farinae]|uniref:Uncharacterized protein n=1 Tax=Dermatophagoides farinae TaxID=6954 RepID=A0A922IAP2_DERFA|nr:hypothetical protein DERF_001535 [Dermatophagoides farinae]
MFLAASEIYNRPLKIPLKIIVTIHSKSNHMKKKEKYTRMIYQSVSQSFVATSSTSSSSREKLDKRSLNIHYSRVPIVSFCLFLVVQMRVFTTYDVASMHVYGCNVPLDDSIL